MNDSRYIIGIDLGTTNIAVFHVDTYDSELAIRPFLVPQLVAAGEVAPRDLLPSFCYLPASEELPEGALELPWPSPDPGAAVGVFARDQGASSPARQVFSAKSWLAHAGIDRVKPILPWGSDLGERLLSPIDVTAMYLRHVRAAWDHAFGRVRDADGSPCVFAEQQVVVTIPASFDETARELTLEAARRAGCRDLTLLEEPLAAFYAWLNRHADAWRQQLQPGERVLVIDVGGGTTDLSFIELDEHGSLHRFAVGDHLLLGGDNIDIAMARDLEHRWQTKLNAADYAMLCQRCRQAKEAILEGGAESADVTLMGKGSSVLHNLRKATIHRADLVKLLTDGFYPVVPVDTPPPRRTSGIRHMGLPYAQEPAVTIHLLHFLRYAARIAGGQDATDSLLYPHKLLFNGGSMRASIARDQVLKAIASWFPGQPTPVELAGEDYSLAVAVGATYYGRVRRGAGVKVRGGIARSYFIQASDAAGAERYLCVMPRDTSESTSVRVPGTYRLQTNDKVLFNLFSSATRLADTAGDQLGPEATDELSQVAPLVTVLRYGRGEKEAINAQLITQLTEIGTLEVVLEAVGTGHRWPLRFDLRPAALAAEPEALAHLVVDAATAARAVETVRNAFAAGGGALANLVGDLETTLDLGRDNWSRPILRELADVCLEVAEQRLRTPQHESRWLNLAGFCLRPGIGDPADPLRLRQVWKLWFEGPKHDRNPQVLADWWVFWRRLAPGLKSGHQIAIADSLEKILAPKGSYRTSIREGDQAKHEMWRCLGALEQLPIARKQRLGDLLIGRIDKLDPYEYWTLARLGARHPFHAPLNLVLPAVSASRWLDALLSARPPGPSRRMRLFAVSLLAAQTGDRHLDLPPEAVARALAFLADGQAPAVWQNRLQQRLVESREEGAQMLGDALPAGLIIVDAD